MIPFPPGIGVSPWVTASFRHLLRFDVLLVLLFVSHSAKMSLCPSGSKDLGESVMTCFWSEMVMSPKDVWMTGAGGGASAPTFQLMPVASARPG